MAVFAYRAVTPAGERIRGSEEAASAFALTSALGTRGLTVLDVSQPTPPDSGWVSRIGRSRHVLDVTRAMAALLPAGLPLTRSLAAVGDLATGDLARSLEAVRRRVERGDTLAAALSDHPLYFSPIYVGVIRAGERSGDLPGAFARLTKQLEKEEEVRSKLLSAAVYPLLLCLVGVVAVTVLMLFVLPRFAELLQDSGGRLPRSTAFLIGFSAIARKFWLLFLVIPVAIGVVLVRGAATARGSRLYSAIVLRVPVIGAFRRHALASRFARLLSVLMYGGSPLINALDDSAQSVGDPLAREEVLRVRARVREGVSLQAALGEGSLFPGLLRKLVAVGEESGRLQQFLDKAADIFDESTQRSLQRLVAVAEPLMIVLFGGVVGLVALSLLQAIYGINAGSFR